MDSLVEVVVDSQLLLEQLLVEQGRILGGTKEACHIYINYRVFMSRYQTD